MKKKNIILIVLAAFAALGGLYWAFSKNEQDEFKSSPADLPTGEVAPGEAENISDLSANCQKKFRSWKSWMLARPYSEWTKQVRQKADAKGVSMIKQLEGTFVYMVNRGSQSC